MFENASLPCSLIDNYSELLSIGQSSSIDHEDVKFNFNYDLFFSKLQNLSSRCFLVFKSKWIGK